VAITIGAETKQPINSLIKLVEAAVADLAQAGVLSELNILFDFSLPVATVLTELRRKGSLPLLETTFRDMESQIVESIGYAASENRGWSDPDPSISGDTQIGFLPATALGSQQRFSNTVALLR
jgi:hypothetical protein